MRAGGARRLAVGLLLLALALAAAAAAAPRHYRHRLHLPPPPRVAPAPPTTTGALPTSLSVDEVEYHLSPSHLTVAAGPVTIRAYNRGMDDHDLTLVDQSGQVFRVYLKPGTSGTLTPTLAPGDYTVICSLFAGTPESHEALGMHFVLQVR
jgi:hypothetical protein